MTVDIAHFKEKLLSEKADLTKELSRHGRIVDTETGDWMANVEPADDAEQDPTAEGDRMESISNNLAMLSTLEARYSDVIKALTRIQNNNYGTCTVDSKEIEKERLEANPAATTCIEHLEG